VTPCDICKKMHTGRRCDNSAGVVFCVNLRPWLLDEIEEAVVAGRADSKADFIRQAVLEFL